MKFASVVASCLLALPLVRADPPNTWDNSYCMNMQPVCTADAMTIDLQATISNNGPAGKTLHPEDANGNLFGSVTNQPGPQWFYLQVDAPGAISMELSAPNDIDFVLWGPFSNLENAKQSCHGGLTNVHSDNYSSTNTEHPVISNGQHGEIYVLLVTNFAEKHQEATLKKLTGDGDTNCNIVPTHSPTVSPAPSVTPGTPTAAPIFVPPEPANTAVTGTGNGDPHFMTFGGDKYDFHGGCDLVLLDSPNFANGLGLKIHIRTEIESWWSYIKHAVVQIGSHTFELKGSPAGEGPVYWIDGMTGNDIVELEPSFGALEQSLQAQLKCFKVHYKKVSSKQHKFRIDLSCQGDAISMGTYNEWVSVNTKCSNKENFYGSKGLLGAYPDGLKIARDGKSVMVDTDAFGKEWQVQSDEPMLFYSVEGVQHPEACSMPNHDAAVALKKRRLGEAVLTRDDAIRACAHADENDREACIYDVLAINNLDFAGAY